MGADLAQISARQPTGAGQMRNHAARIEADAGGRVDGIYIVKCPPWVGRHPLAALPARTILMHAGAVHVPTAGGWRARLTHKGHAVRRRRAQRQCDRQN